MEALGILRAARKKIAKPEGWGKGLRYRDRPRDTCCAAEAIEEVAGADSRLRFAAIRAVYNAAGLDLVRDSIADWNDAPERTHSEVLAVFNLAIATLRL